MKISKVLGLVSLSALVGIMLTVLVGLAAVPATVAAQAVTTAANTTAAATPGSTINVFCLDFEKDFPVGQTVKAQGLANGRVRGALAYALSKGYVTSNPYQVQMAVYRLQDNQPFRNTRNENTAVAQEIVDNAGNTPSAGDPAALANLTITNIQPATQERFYGTGVIQGNVDARTLPVGFILPASAANFQNMVAVVVTTQPASTATAAPTATATAAPTTTPAPIASPAPTAPPAPSVLGMAQLPNSGAGGTSEPSLATIAAYLALFVLASAAVVGIGIYAFRRTRA